MNPNHNTLTPLKLELQIMTSTFTHLFIMIGMFVLQTKTQNYTITNVSLTQERAIFSQ